MWCIQGSIRLAFKTAPVFVCVFVLRVRQTIGTPLTFFSNLFFFYIFSLILKITFINLLYFFNKLMRQYFKKKKFMLGASSHPSPISNHFPFLLDYGILKFFYFFSQSLFVFLNR